MPATLYFKGVFVLGRSVGFVDGTVERVHEAEQQPKDKEVEEVTGVQEPTLEARESGGRRKGAVRGGRVGAEV